MNKISLIGAGSSFGVNVDGAESGPAILIRKIKENNTNKIYNVEKFEYKKELEKENKEKNLEAVDRFNKNLYDIVQKVLAAEEVPLTIGGDHSIAIASSLASISKYEKLGVIWFDAHGDFNTFETTITGNLHGLPLAVITGYEKGKLSEFHKGSLYNPKNAVIVGARDLDEQEKVNLKNAGVTIFTTEDLKKEGVKEIVEKAMKIATNGTKGVHISYDIDLIDPIIAPGVSVPAKDGINEIQAKEVIDEFLKYNNLIKSIDVVEFNPKKDIDGKTEKITLDIIKNIIK